MNFEETIVGKLTEVYQTVHLKEFRAGRRRQGLPFECPKNGNGRPLRPRPRAGRESIDADQLMRVNLAASATGAVDRAPAFDVKGHDLSFCAAPKDADGTYVKRDPNILWQSVVAFAPRGPEAAER